MMRLTPEFQRQHWLRCAFLVHDQDDQRDKPDRADEDGRDVWQAAALHQHHHQRGDRCHHRDRSKIVDPMLPMFDRFLQERRHHRDRSNADRQIDPEHQLPADLLHQERTK